MLLYRQIYKRTSSLYDFYSYLIVLHSSHSLFQRKRTLRWGVVWCVLWGKIFNLKSSSSSPPTLQLLGFPFSHNPIKFRFFRFLQNLSWTTSAFQLKIPQPNTCDPTFDPLVFPLEKHRASFYSLYIAHGRISLVPKSKGLHESTIWILAIWLHLTKQNVRITQHLFITIALYLLELKQRNSGVVNL